MFALIDCNNFYASCEQVFNPKLRSRPVVVLSNNDGCVIARSQSARALGIPMGAPAFLHRETFLCHDVVSLSANFTLYGDMSHRVHEVLESFDFPVETYSIDESFIDLSSAHSPEEIGYALYAKVRQWTGIPTSVGIAKTKTLAKVANKLCKKRQTMVTINPEEHLSAFPVEDVWGVGRRLSRQLRMHGIETAADLRDCDDHWIKKRFSVVLLRTVYELRGIPCIELEETAAARGSILTSRSFKTPLFSLSNLREALSHFAAMAAAKLRDQKCRAGALHIFYRTSEKQTRSATVTFPISTAHTPHFLARIEKSITALYKPGDAVKKAGVLLTAITSDAEQQDDLFARGSSKTLPLVDAVNRRYGRDALFYAAEGTHRPWRRVANHLSPRYTSSWSDLPRAS